MFKTFIQKAATGFVFAAFLGSGVSAQLPAEADQIPAKYKWDLTDIYESWTPWEADLQKINALMDEIITMEGKIGESSDQLFKVLSMQDQLGRLAEKAFRYPYLMRNLDTRNSEVGSKFQQIQIMFARFGTAVSWMEPEMLAIPEATIQKWIAEDVRLEPYRFDLEDMYRQQKHVLSAEMETLLSYMGPMGGAASSIYTELSVSDIEYPTIKTSTGEEIQLSPGAYSSFMQTCKVQADRAKAAEAYYGVYNKNKNTYASIYNGVCQADWAWAQARNYKSVLESQLETDDIPTEVYTNLVETVGKHTEPVKRYMKLRKKVLGLDEMHRYDGSVPLIDWDKKYPYDEASKMVMESVKPMGKDYHAMLESAFEGGWVDVYEKPGKVTGAFSLNVYGVHPYMLMNYNETMDNMFTLAHEMGHSMHSMLSNEFQPYNTHQYTIFVAEVASTFNERLLLDYMMKNSKDPEERIALLVQSIENIIGTFYVQSVFADYELQVHQMVENGQPITPEVLDQLMRKLYTNLYGDVLVNDDFYDVVWSRISHFYEMPFYVYQYATCFASSAKLYDDVMNVSKKEHKVALNRYLDLLKSGGNDHPMNQLKKAGVDLSQPDAILAVVKQLDDMVAQLEIEMEKLN